MPWSESRSGVTWAGITGVNVPVISWDMRASRKTNLMSKYVVKRFGMAAAGLLAMTGCGAEPLQGEDEAVFSEGSSASETVSPGGDEPSEDSVVVDKALFPSGRCDTAQRAAIASAESVGIIQLAAIVLNEDELVNNPTASGQQQLTLLFGADTLAERQFVVDTYRNILNTFSDTDYDCVPDGEPVANPAGVPILCGDNNFAIAGTVRAGRLTRLCDLFFDEPSSIRRAGTLIHELSHQDRTSPDGDGTDDINEASIRAASRYEIYAPRCLAQTCL